MMNLERAQAIPGLRKIILQILNSLSAWHFDGEESRRMLHSIGTDLQTVRTALAGQRMDAQFPTFSRPAAATPSKDTRQRALRRRELIMMVHKLPASNLEILEWLAGGQDREAAYLYAYGRGSASETSPYVKTEFYQHVQKLVDTDPILFPFKGVEVMLHQAQAQYSSCQSVAYEKMD